METKEDKLNELFETFSPKQLRYVAVRPYCSSDAEAAERVGVSKSTVYHWDNKDDLEKAVRLLTTDAIDEARYRLKALVAKAVDVLSDELTRGVRGDSTRLRAALEVMNRSGLTSEQKVDVTSGGKPITPVSSEEQARAIKKLQDLLEE